MNQRHRLEQLLGLTAGETAFINAHRDWPIVKVYGERLEAQRRATDPAGFTLLCEALGDVVLAAADRRARDLAELAQRAATEAGGP